MGKTPHARAVELFGQCGIWDTEANNGVLIYLLLADRRVEILADRGFGELVTHSEWRVVCKEMEMSFREGQFAEGVERGIKAAGLLIARHFPVKGNRNELPDRPALI